MNNDLYDVARGVRSASPSLDEIRGWPAVVSVGWAASALAISRSHAYELIKQGVFPLETISVGASKRVLTADIIATLSGSRR